MIMIESQLERWLKDKGESPYVEDKDVLLPSSIENFQLYPTHGIQQNKEEILEFVEFISNLDNRDNVLEIGLGHYGSTHFIWKHLFHKILTIEKDWDRIRKFGKNIFDFYGEWNLKESYFINHKSYEPKSVESVRRILDEERLDLLFIDAQHDYESVLTDFILYKDLVKNGGIIAFHDIQCKLHDRGVPHFIEDLEEGRIDGKRHKVNKIIHTEHLGIGWIEVGVHTSARVQGTFSFSGQPQGHNDIKFIMKDFDISKFRNCDVLPSRQSLMSKLPKNSIGMEIGVEAGNFSDKILNIVNPSELHLVELDTGLYEGLKIRFQDFLNQGQIKVKNEDSRVALKEFEDVYFDWIYID